MRFRLVLLFLALTSASAFAQRESKFEAAMGIGTDIVPPAGVFKNQRNLSASICYNLTDQWGVALYLGQQVYRLDGLTSAHARFLDGRTPQVSRTATSLLVAGRYFIPSKSKGLNPYVSVGLGYAKSVSSPEGYYVVGFVPPDTVFEHVETGQFLLGLLSLGIQVRPLSFFDLFAELQAPFASNIGLSPGPIACRIGIGVVF
jgi:hypothetical protein